MRFDTTVTGEDLAYKPTVFQDERDEVYLKNIKRKHRRLQIVNIKGIGLVLDPDTGEVFDLPAFQDTKRLIQIGKRVSQTEIRWVNPIKSTVFSSN